MADLQLSRYRALPETSRGDAYRRYVETTSAFVPWPPRTPPSGSD